MAQVAFEVALQDGGVLNLGFIGRREPLKHRESLGQRDRAGRVPDAFRGWW